MGRLLDRLDNILIKKNNRIGFCLTISFEIIFIEGVWHIGILIALILPLWDTLKKKLYIFLAGYKHTSYLSYCL